MMNRPAFNQLSRKNVEIEILRMRAAEIERVGYRLGGRHLALDVRRAHQGASQFQVQPFCRVQCQHGEGRARVHDKMLGMAIDFDRHREAVVILHRLQRHAVDQLQGLAIRRPGVARQREERGHARHQTKC